MRPSNLHLKLSAYHALFGQFNFNRTPIIPPGTCVMIYETPHQQTFFGVKGLKGWYFGPVPDYYLCYNIFANKANDTRIGETVEFIPHHYKLPVPNSQDCAIIAAKELTQAL